MNRPSTFAIATVALGIDRLLKWWVGGHLVLYESRPLIGQVIRLTRVHNIGGALGIFPGSGALFLVVSGAVSAWIVFFLLRHKDQGALMGTGLALLLGGALGNLIDRVVYGYVLDFLEIRGLFVNNFADVCVSVGTALVFIHVLFGGEKDRTTG
ncbi:MAG TPA: signal peptidase II [Candidatus Acetothermia bacterium]|nr:signal peptidase II [Candidatus Acetothermia bacterium]